MGSAKPTATSTYSQRYLNLIKIDTNFFVIKACKRHGWFTTVVQLSEFNSTICTDRNMSLPIVENVDANYDLNLFIMNYVFGPEVWNKDVARSLGLFWFDQAIMLDAVSMDENDYVWSTFDGVKLNFTKWGYGHPQEHHGVTFSAKFLENSTDQPTVKQQLEKIKIIRPI